MRKIVRQLDIEYNSKANQSKIKSVTFNTCNNKKEKAPSLPTKLPPLPSAPDFTPPESPNLITNISDKNQGDKCTPVPPPRRSIITKTNINQNEVYPFGSYISVKKEFAPLPPISKSLIHRENDKKKAKNYTEDPRHKTQETDENCIICMEATVNCAFLNCGHSITCYDCAIDIHKCPYCRKNIEEKLKIYKR